MADISEYKVGVILSLENCGKSGGGKALKACKVNIGDPDNPITVVTAATNVREGSRLAVAVEGSKIVDEKTGEEITIKKTAVGGVTSEGMFCDSRMLGWVGGAEGVAQQIPDSIEIGAPPPSSKPRVDFVKEKEPDVPAVEVKPLFEKKLTKEEKKKIAEEKRKAKKAAKEAKKSEE